MNWVHYKFRFYDSQLSRFHSVDPLADKYSYNSVYAFAENKLGLGMELEGLELGPDYRTNIHAAKAAGISPVQYQNHMDKGAGMLFSGTQIEAKIGGGATLGFELKLAGFELNFYGNNGTFNLGFNTSDGVIDEYTEGGSASLSAGGQTLIGVSSESVTAFNVPGATLPDGRTDANSVTKIEKNSNAGFGTQRETSTQTSFNAKANSNTYQNRALAKPGANYIKQHVFDRTKKIDMSSSPSGPATTKNEASIVWFGFEVKAGLNIQFEVKTVIPLRDGNAK